MKSTYYPPGIPVYVAPTEAGIGYAWADFYKCRLMNRGFTQYRIEKVAPPMGTKQDNLYNLYLYSQELQQPPGVEKGWQIWPNAELYSARRPSAAAQYIIYLPKSIPYTSSVELDSVHNEPLFAITRSRSTDPADFVPTIYENYLLGMNSIEMYLKHSQNFLDDSVQIVSTACDHEYLDSFIDYLYFSVATLSTTGYGDITAIDPVVRVMTIVEIVLGWLLLLLFGSLLVSSLTAPETKSS